MIIEFLLNPFFWFVEFLFNLLPDMSHIDPLSDFDISVFIYILSYGFYIFPFSLFMIFVSNILFWKSTQLTWAIIEWIYKKIPGVN